MYIHVVLQCYCAGCDRDVESNSAFNLNREFGYQGGVKDEIVAVNRFATLKPDRSIRRMMESEGWCCSAQYGLIRVSKRSGH